jgi:hypothetical protein
MPDRQISERQSLGWKKVWIAVCSVQVKGGPLVRSRIHTGGSLYVV